MASAAHSQSYEFKNASLANFAGDRDRKLFEQAMAKVGLELGSCFALKTGQKVPQKTEAFQPSFNPSKPTQVVGYVEYGNLETVERALQQVSKAQKKWADTPALERSARLFALADWLEKKRYELSAWMVFEVGKSWKEADADVAEAIDFCRFYAGNAPELFSPVITQHIPGEKDFLIHEPKGVVAVIAPWNFPLAILTGMAVAALVTGNAVILKPAEQSSVIASFLAQGLAAAGFPEEVFFFLPGRGEEIGPKLVSDPRVDMIAFTGSAAVGFQIIQTAAQPPKENQKGIKKVIAELGGKNALIIDEDADLDEAVAGAVHSAFGFQGQKCSALSRLIVHENVYDVFVKRFVEATQSLQIGPAMDPAYAVGPVIDEEAYDRILKTIESAKSRLKLLFQGKLHIDEGYFVPPTIFECEDIKDDIFQNEIFGPVVAIKKVHDLDEAIQVANSVKYALTGGIFSRSPSHIERVMKEFKVGNLYINRGITGAVVQRHPFGGFKHSGIGSKAGGEDYLKSFVDPRLIAENTVRRGFAES